MSLSKMMQGYAARKIQVLIILITISIQFNVVVAVDNDAVAQVRLPIRPIPEGRIVPKNEPYGSRYSGESRTPYPESTIKPFGSIVDPRYPSPAPGILEGAAGFASIASSPTDKCSKIEFYIAKIGGKLTISTNYVTEHIGYRAPSYPTWSAPEGNIPSITIAARDLLFPKKKNIYFADNRTDINDHINALMGAIDPLTCYTYKHDQNPPELFGKKEFIGRSNDYLYSSYFSSQSLISNAKIFIHRNAIGSDGRPLIDLADAEHIQIVDNDGLIKSGNITQLKVGGGRSPLIELIKGCCLHGQPPGGGEAILSRLRVHALNAENTKIGSLVIDSSTSSYLRRSKILSSMRLTWKSQDSWDVRLRGMIEKSRGANFILISHIVNSRVTVEDASGKELYSVALDDVQKMAEESDVNLILIGCETATDLQKSGLNIGVIGKYNTLDAAKRIETSIQQSNNAEEFLSRLASEDVKIVVRPDNWAKNGSAAEVYSLTSRLRKQFTRLMRVWMMG